MKMMRRLLENLGRSWEKIPKEVPAISIKRGAGTHPFLTVDSKNLYLHTLPYNKDLPVKQSILLEDLTLNELVDTLNGMGYEASVTSEAVNKGFDGLKSYTLMHTVNRPFIDGTELTTFSSKLWKTLYPIARLLEEADNDIDKAIEQMYAVTTSGRWLEYWASFFRITRNVGETDVALSRRLFLSLVNLKTNDIAIEELLEYAVQGKSKVKDFEPARFAIEVEPEYMDEAGIIRPIVEDLKGAGIDYVLSYNKELEEDYRGFVEDRDQSSFEETDDYNSDVHKANSEVMWHTSPDNHPWFRLNYETHTLSSDVEILDVTEPIDINRDEHTVEFEKDFGTESYEKLTYTGHGFILNDYENRSTLSGGYVLPSGYHGTDFFTNMRSESTYSEAFASPSGHLGHINSDLREHTYKVRKSSDSVMTTNDSTLNSSGELTGWEERMSDYAMEQAMESMDIFNFNRDQRDRSNEFFFLNTGTLNNSDHTLYGEVIYGDIIKAITVESAETFPDIMESVGKESVDIYTEHAHEPHILGSNGFRLNATTLVDGASLSVQDLRTSEVTTMKLEDSSGIVREETV